MKTAIFMSIVLYVQQSVSLATNAMEALTIYYDENNVPVPMITNVSQVFPSLKVPSVRFGPLPCSCQDLTCGCCANMNIQFLNFERHACTNFTYDPYEFSIGMNMLWNDESIFQRNISGKNPPPICVQAPVPYLPTIDQCVRLFKIFTPGRNLHMCMNLETRIERVPVLILQFDCMRMGLDGVSLLKPEEEGGLKPQQEETTENPTVESSEMLVESQQEAANIYDPVDPNKKTANQTHGEYKQNYTNIVDPTIVLMMNEDDITVTFNNETVKLNTTTKEGNFTTGNSTTIEVIEIVEDNH